MVEYMLRPFKPLVTFYLVMGFSAPFHNSIQASEPGLLRNALEECHQFKKWVVKNKYSVVCSKNYQHYNSKAYKKYDQGKDKFVRIGSFNSWNVGSDVSRFKDLKILAQLANQYDLLAAQELLPTVGKDKENNKKVLNYISQNPDQIKEAAKLYRLPGFLKILSELRKFDDSWALILSPIADGTQNSHHREHTGFFYRAKKVIPVANEHCSKRTDHKDGLPFACFPDLTSRFLGKVVRDVFSRRPFIANFKSGKFTFTAITSHTTFTSPANPEDMRKILRPSFGVEDYREIGKGVTKQNYARFAEIKIILDLMIEMKKRYRQKDIFYLGDMNVSQRNPYWKELIADKEFDLFGNVPTTMAMGYGTKGEANDLDHVLLNPQETNECAKANSHFKISRYKFTDGKIGALIRSKYLVRNSSGSAMTSIGRKRMEAVISSYRKKWKTLKTIKGGVIVPDTSKIEQNIELLKERIFKGQLKKETYYRFYKEIISDHYPIGFTCSR